MKCLDDWEFCVPGLRRHCQSLKMTLLLRKCLQLHIIHLGGSSVSLSHAGGGSRRAFSSCQRLKSLYSQQLNPYQVLGVKPGKIARVWFKVFTAGGPMTFSLLYWKCKLYVVVFKNPLKFIYKLTIWKCRGRELALVQRGDFCSALYLNPT